ncbi:MAG: GlsB/YeaQ/YmgE family stress response membrane protein [Chloroflexota bacterium]|nr:GlsB/YeaQ/YmgE family stress response membrane protein [Chloroflexota bacterium]
MGAIVIVVLAIIGLLVILPLVGNIIGLIVMLLIWALIGWLAGKLMRGRGFGTVGNILLGAGGGLVGNFVFGLLGWNLPIIGGVIGAVLLVYLVRALGIDRNFAR